MVDEAAPPSVRVPEGFSVTLHAIRSIPSVDVLESGLVLASFGSGSDDPAQLMLIIEQARAAVQRLARATPLFATSVRGIEDLLTVESPEMAAAQRNVLWMCSGDGLRIALDGGKRQWGLIADLLSLPSLGLVIDSGWRAGTSLFGGLRAAGVAVWETSRGAPFLVEVARPEGIRVHALTVPDAPERPVEPQIDPVWSSPGMRQVLLQAAATSSFVELQRVLAQRSIPLLFVAGENGSPMMRTWPDVPGPVLPVFADLESLHRSAAGMGLKSEGYEVGALRFANLMQWAHMQHVLVAVGFFDEKGAASYIPLPIDGQ